MLISKVTAFISSHSLISPNDHIIAAVSGGLDSMCLLHLLQQLQESLNFTVSVLHVNHGIRGRESDQDEEFVCRICTEMRIPCTANRLQGFTRESGENILRKARYKLYDHEIRKFQNSKIATAHHLDDQLETFLMRLFKGSGSKGLIGIPEIRGKYIRPLLSCSRQEIVEYCKQKNIPFREDSTNFETDKLRNSIREFLKPGLKKVFGDDFLKGFEQGHGNYKNLYQQFYNLNAQYFSKIITVKDDQIICSCDNFNRLSDLQKAQFLEYCFSDVYGLNFAGSNEQTGEFNRFVHQAGSGALFKFDKSVHVLKDRARIIFYKPDKNETCFRELYAGENVNFENYFLEIKKVDRKDVTYNTDKNIEFINGDILEFPLVVRNWNHGDWFYPYGGKGRQKLSDFFINQKIDRIHKKHIPVVLNKKDIIWIAGLRLDERFKVKKNSKNIYQLKLKKNDR